MCRHSFRLSDGTFVFARGYGVVGQGWVWCTKEEEEAERLLADAQALQDAGCFALVLEKIPASLAAKVSAQLSIPVIGIGAGNEVDGQVLVAQDMLGMNKGFAPKFLRRYADLYTIITDAVQRYVADVKSGDYPNKEEQY